MTAQGLSRRAIGHIMGALTLVRLHQVCVVEQERLEIVSKSKDIKRRKAYMLKGGLLKVLKTPFKIVKRPKKRGAKASFYPGLAP